MGVGEYRGRLSAFVFVAALVLLVSWSSALAATTTTASVSSAGPGVARLALREVRLPSAPSAGSAAVSGDAMLLDAPIVSPAVACDTSWTGGDGDWTNAGDWSGGVPDSTKNACLPAGSYTVSIAGESVAAKTLDVGAGVTLSLQITSCSPSNAVLTLSGNMTNEGTVDLANLSDACGGVAQIVVPSGSTLTSSGTVETSGSNRGLRELTGNVTNTGTVHVNMNGCSGCDPKSTLQLDPGTSAAVFNNEGAVEIDSLDTMTVLGVVGSAPAYEFQNNTGGSVTGTVDGSCSPLTGSGPCTSSGAIAGTFVVYGGNTFTEGAGTTSGNPVVISGDGDTLHFTGSGASTFVLYGSNTIGSTIAAGQTVWLNDIGCGPRSSIATFAGSETNNGTINLNNANDACGGTAQLVVPSGSTLTNNGTIQTTGCCRGTRELSGNVTNYGTVAVGHAQSSGSPTLTIDPGTFDNHGTFNVPDGDTVSVVGDTVLAELDHPIDLNTSGSYTQDASSILGVVVDAVDTTYSGISGGNTSLAGTLQVTTLGLPAPGSNWPVIAGSSRTGSFANCSFGSTCTFGSTNYQVDGPSTGVTLVAQGATATATEPSSTTGTITALPGAGVAVGMAVYDAATVTGNSTQSPTGTVTFYTCGPPATSCTNSGTPLGSPIGLSGSGGTATAFSSGFTPSSPGTYCFAGYYSGDQAYPASSDTTADECFTVTKASPSINTTLSATTITAGQSAHDSATLTGYATGGTGGTVTYTAYTDNGCSANPQSAGTVNVDPSTGSAPASNPITFNTAGAFYWQAADSGDSNNSGATSTCTSEQLTVTSASTPTSQITPTNTACSQFSTGTAATLTQIQYALRNGKVSQVNPGVLFYWVKVTAGSGNQTITITQTISTASRPFLTASGSNAYKTNCSTVSGTKVTQSTGTGTVTVKFNAGTGGTFFIGIKLSPSNVVGENAPAPATVHYAFTTTGVTGSTNNVDLSKK
jgi:hypothetical protein